MDSLVTALNVGRHLTTKHGLAGRSPLDPNRHPLYARWVSLRQRCNNPQNHRYPEYGARGITCCAEWQDFAAFARYIGNLPHALEPGYSLDRIDNDGSYEPGNVKWSTAAEQRHNQRRLPRHLREIIERENEYYAVREQAAVAEYRAATWLNVEEPEDF